MPYVPVQAVAQPDGHPIVNQIGKLCEAVQHKAFELFEKRGFTPGQDLEDWFRAERELLSAPPSELVETENEMELRVALPGFELKDIQVTALPNQFFVQASAKKQKKEEGKVHWSQFSSKEVCRRVDLPAAIDVNSTKALFANGMLTISADKAEMAKPKKVSVSTASVAKAASAAA